MTILLLIRHGESEWNRAGRIQGQVDTPLTEKGIAQAQAIGDYLATRLREQQLRIYASPLSRAHQTAAIIAEILGHKAASVQDDERINDFDQGEIAGTYGWDTVTTTHPELARMRLEDPFGYHPPGGESGYAFRDRLSDFLDHLPVDDTINMVVSHGIVNKYIRSIRRNLSGSEIIALGEAQDTIYRLDGDKETEINISNSIS